MLKLFPQYGYRDLKHFQTLHSLAFTTLGMKKDNVMQAEHYEEIGKSLGVQVSVYRGGEEETGYIDSDSEYFNLINIAMNQKYLSEMNTILIYTLMTWIII